MASKGKKKLTLYDLSKEHLQASDLPAFIAELKNESDRACALVGAAVIDHQLMDLLIENMRPLSETEIDETFNGRNAILANLSGKTEVAFLFGVINAKERKAIDCIRRIRNAFAHSAKTLTFEQELIVNEIKKINFIETKEELTAKNQFIEFVTQLLVKLLKKTVKIIVKKNAPPSIGNLKMPDEN